MSVRFHRRCFVCAGRTSSRLRGRSPGSSKEKHEQNLEPAQRGEAMSWVTHQESVLCFKCMPCAEEKSRLELRTQAQAKISVLAAENMYISKPVPEFILGGRRGVWASSHLRKNCSIFQRPLNSPSPLFPASNWKEKSLLEETANLTQLLQEEVRRKADAERRQSRRNILDDAGDRYPMPSSELRRYGKKLEDAVRSREQAAVISERFSLARPGGSHAFAGASGVIPRRGGEKGDRRRGAGLTTGEGGGEGDRATPHSIPTSIGISCSSRWESRRHGDTSATLEPPWESEGRDLRGAALASRLRGVVRDARNRKALLDDERFFS